MKIFSSRKISALLLVSCLILSASSIDLSIDVLKNDVISYDISYLEYGSSNSKLRGSPQDYETDQAYAVLSTIKEVAFGDIPGTDSNNVGYGLYKDTDNGPRIFTVGDTNRFVALTVDEQKITARTILATINQKEFRTLTSSDTYSLVTTAREDDQDYMISVKYFEKNDFSGAAVDLDWTLTSGTQDFPTVNTSTEIWKDDTTEYFVAHQQHNEYVTKMSNKVYWYERNSSPVNQGEIVLNIASKFPVDSTAILTASILNNELWVGYLTATSAGVANCKLTVTAEKVEIADVADCTDYPLPQGVPVPTSIRVYSEDSKFYAYLLSRTENTFSLGSCTLDSVTKSMKDCLNSNKSIDISGEKFLRFEFDSANGARVLFSDSDNATEIKVVSTIVFGVEFQADEGVVNFDYLQDKNSKTLIASPNKVFSLRTSTYSTFSSVSDQLYVSIFTKNIVGNQAVIKFRKENASSFTLFSTVTINLSQDSTGGYSRTAQLPSVVNYKQDQLIKVPTSRTYFTGNSLDFAIENPDFKIYNTYTWRDSATEGINGDISIAGSVGGITTDSTNKTVQAFYCDVVGLNANFKCQLDGEATSISDFVATIFAVEATPYDLTDSSIIAVTTSAVDTQVNIFKKGSPSKSDTITGFVATSLNTHYQRIEQLYTIWQIAGGKITVSTWDNSSLTGAKTVTVDNTTFGIVEPLSFCPVSVQSNPADPGQTFVVSSCDNAQNAIVRIYTLEVSQNQDKTLKVQANETYKTLINRQYGDKNLKICSLGSEHIIQNVDASKAISSADLVSNNGFQQIDVSTYLKSSDVDLICIRGSMNFIVANNSAAGDKSYTAMFGNRAGNILNRYHSLNLLDGDLSGYQVESASWHLSGYTVTLKKGTQKKFQTVILDGPWIFYTGDTLAKTDIELKVSSQGQNIATEKFSIQIDAFISTVKVSTIKADSKPVKGVQPLSSIVDISGPVYDLVLEKNGSTANVTLQGAFQDDKTFKPVYTKDLAPPMRVKSDQKSKGYNIGYSQNAQGIAVYLYENYTTIQEIFQINANINSFEAIDVVHLGDNDITFGIIGTVDGSNNQLQWFAKSTGKEDLKMGLIQGAEKLFITEVKIVQVQGFNCVALGIDKINKRAVYFVIQLNQSPYNAEVLTGDISNNCNYRLVFFGF